MTHIRHCWTKKWLKLFDFPQKSAALRKREWYSRAGVPAAI